MVLLFSGPCITLASTPRDPELNLDRWSFDEFGYFRSTHGLNLARERALKALGGESCSCYHQRWGIDEEPFWSRLLPGLRRRRSLPAIPAGFDCQGNIMDWIENALRWRGLVVTRHHERGIYFAECHGAALNLSVRFTSTTALWVEFNYPIDFSIDSSGRTLVLGADAWLGIVAIAEAMAWTSARPSPRERRRLLEKHSLVERAPP
jgi:hypothetical protein